MDEAVLYELIAEKTVYKWRDEVESDDDCIYKKDMLKQKELLCAALDENNRDLVIHFKNAVENYMDNIYYCVDIKLINLCIKIGMELQKFFDGYDG